MVRSHIIALIWLYPCTSNLEQVWWAKHTYSLWAIVLFMTMNQSESFFRSCDLVLFRILYSTGRLTAVLHNQENSSSLDNNMIGRFIHTMSIMYAGESAAVHFFPSLLSHRQIVPLSHTLTIHLHTQIQQFSSLLTTAGSGIMYLRSIFADGCLSDGCDTPRVGESVRPVHVACVCVCVCVCVCACV